MKRKIIISASEQEYQWVRHAAKLRGLTLREYVKRAVNASLRSEGVDAVLFGESNHMGVWPRTKS